MAQNDKRRIGELFVDEGIITEEQLQDALMQQTLSGQRLGRILVTMGFVTPQQKVTVLRAQLGFEEADLANLDEEVVKRLSEEACRKYIAIPVDIRPGERLAIAMEDPLDIFAIDDLRNLTNMEVDPLVASEDDIVGAIDHYFTQQTSVDDLIKDFNPVDMQLEDLGLTSSEKDEVEEGPVIRFVNFILQQALKDRASDIHIEPADKSFRVRYRVDGILRDTASSSRAMHAAIVSRIKIIANLDISEKRLPQDGRVRITIEGREIDMRVSTLPTIYGEKVVIRILDKSKVVVKLAQLGFPEVSLSRYQGIMKQPHGMILVTGPTGSGKTTTLYATLNELNTPEKNIMTVEDPVEYRLEGINQVQVNTRAGFVFARALRAFLRQDPDIIMVGEIRDKETASIAVESALTGHMVLSTLHTNDAAATVVRLTDMGIEHFQVASALSVVLAQRLVRTICPACKFKYEVSAADMDGYDPTFVLEMSPHLPAVLSRGKGCRACNNTGYQGRIGVYELLVMTPQLRKLIIEEGSVDAIRSAAVGTGMRTLKDDGIGKALAGVTTVDEVVRAVYTSD